MIKDGQQVPSDAFDQVLRNIAENPGSIITDEQRRAILLKNGLSEAGIEAILLARRNVLADRAIDISYTDI